MVCACVTRSPKATYIYLTQKRLKSPALWIVVFYCKFSVAKKCAIQISDFKDEKQQLKWQNRQNRWWKAKKNDDRFREKRSFEHLSRSESISCHSPHIFYCIDHNSNFIQHKITINKFALSLSRLFSALNSLKNDLYRTFSCTWALLEKSAANEMKPTKKRRKKNDLKYQAQEIIIISML